MCGLFLIVVFQLGSIWGVGVLLGYLGGVLGGEDVCATFCIFFFFRFLGFSSPPLKKKGGMVFG